MKKDMEYKLISKSGSFDSEIFKARIESIEDGIVRVEFENESMVEFSQVESGAEEGDVVFLLGDLFKLLKKETFAARKEVVELQDEAFN